MGGHGEARKSANSVRLGRMRRGAGRGLVSAGATVASVMAASMLMAAPASASSLPSKLSAQQFYRLVSKADPQGGSSKSSVTMQLALPDSGSMSETFSGRANPQNGQEMAAVTLTLSSQGQTEPFESMSTECFHQSCYVQGDTIGLPVTGETGARWLSVTIPKLKPIYNAFTTLAHDFTGSIHETKLPYSAPLGAAAAYHVSGSFSLYQLITAFSASLPSELSQVTSNPQAKALLDAVSMSFHNALAIVSSNGRLIGLRMPLTITESAAYASQVGSSTGATTSTGELDAVTTSARALHLTQPAPSTTTTPAAVSQSLTNTSPSNTGSTGNTGTTPTTSGNTGTRPVSGNSGSGGTTGSSGTGNSGVGSVGNSG